VGKLQENKYANMQILEVYTCSDKFRHPHCVCNKLDWSVYTCLTQLYGGREMYNLLHKDQLQPTQVKCSCLLSFFNYQPEDGQ